MVCKSTKTIKKSFVNYSHESRLELKELSKLNLIVTTGRYTEKKIFISISKPGVIEIRIYDLSNFSISTYIDFNKKLKSLVR